MQPFSPNPTWKHPLFGADLPTLIRALASDPSFPYRVWPVILSLVLASVVRAPCSWCEHMITAARLNRLPQPRAPVFILGHWRSGTTHLFNLMSRDPQFAWADPFTTGMPWDYMLLGRLMQPIVRRLLPTHRYIDRIPVNPDSPQEDEIALASMQNASYYHGIYFPARFNEHFRKGVFFEGLSGEEIARWRRRFNYYSRKVLIGKTDRTLLVKNPVYTARVRLIRELWPDARFIHIHRSPYVVYESTCRFYRSLLPRFALQPFTEDLADDLVLESYPRMMDSLYKDVQDIDPSRFVELRFEDLDREPLKQIERVYTSLAIPGFAEVLTVFQDYLESIAGYQKHQHAFSEESIRRVDRHWGGLVQKWGYKVPG